jgi:hypothetical protein
VSAAVLPFARNSALARAIASWQAQAWSMLGNPASTWSQRELARRFLQIHGLL